MKAIFTFIFLAISLIAFAQQAPDFTITDSDGVVHELYADHLDQGQTVVLKLFFTSCPPCIALAPWMEEKYEMWGSGEFDVEFIELSTQSFDSNADVAQYKIEHGVTFPGAGFDGGGKDAASVYQSGQFGPFFGTPTLVIIAPDGTVTMGFAYDDFDDLVAATGATGTSGGNGGGGSTDQTTFFNVNASIVGSSSPSSLTYILKPADSDNPQYDITAITGGSLNFEYPSADFPEIENPVIVVQAEGSINDNSINALDLLKMRKHILELEPFTEESQLLAADVNSDNKINPVDLVNLQKALLDLISEFPNGTPSWKSIPTQIELTEDFGETLDINFQLVKVGNVN